MSARVPLVSSSAKLRDLRDQPYPLSASGLPMLASESKREDEDAMYAALLAAKMNDKTTPKNNTLTTAATTLESNSSGGGAVMLLRSTSDKAALSSGSSSLKNVGDEAPPDDGKTTTTKKKKKKGPPNMRMCHLCGTPQLLGSYKLHFARCAQAWELEENEKPASLRRPLPSGPRLEDGTQPTASTPEAALRKFNDEALVIWKSRSLETCPNCLRSFHAKALRAHVKGCHGDDFLGASFLGSSKHRSKVSSRAYPTVQQSLERSPRVAVSKASKFELDERAVEKRRSVPRQKSFFPPSSPPAQRRNNNDSFHASSSYDANSLAARQPRNDKKHHPRNDKKNHPRNDNKKTSSSSSMNVSFKERLSALETNQYSLAEALARIEDLLRSSPAAAPVTKSPSTKSPSPTKVAILLREHHRIFRSSIDLAWPENNHQQTPHIDKNNNTKKTDHSKKKPATRQVHSARATPKTKGSAGHTATTQRREDGEYHLAAIKKMSPHHKKHPDAPSPQRGFTWRPETLSQ